MIRAFAAIALPDSVRFDLGLVQQGLPLPRPVAAENLHLTLVFLGEVPASVLADVDLAFGAIRAPGFPLTVAGLDLFGGAKARMVYAGVAAQPALVHLQAKVETAARGAGISVPARRYMPHITLARLPERLENRERLERAVAMRAGYAGPTLEVDAFHLYRSHLGRGGPVYEELASYPLG
jgi:2'-5' RNA ligase